MRISEIALSWFRGAGDRIVLDTGNRSAVVCGLNGAGKTSFVDGVEYQVANGKIAHLAHEHSGQRQERAVINTHAPENADRRVEMVLDDGTTVTATIGEDGTPEFDGRDALIGWDCGRIILRQDEVANFIHAPKSEKYSAVLPLIGLSPLENVAVNAHALIRKVQDQSDLERKKGKLEQLRQRWEEAFAGMSDADVEGALKALHAEHLPDAEETPENLIQIVNELLPVLEARIAGLNSEHRVDMLLKTAHDASPNVRMDELTAASARAAGFAEPLLEERLGVLNSAGRFGANLERVDDIQCPACGQRVGVREFRNHVEAETRRLEQALEAYGARRQALGNLATAIGNVVGALDRDEMTDWREHANQENIRQHLDFLRAVDTDQLRTFATPELIADLDEAISPIVERLQECADRVPPSVEELVDAKTIGEAAASDPSIKSLTDEIAAIEELQVFVTQAEAQTRAEIKERTENLIAEISDDMQRMWEILHPGEPINGVRLYQAADADKAIDIALQFHGVEQLSPRLTLSEGHRNSLGLCVFLALAKRGGHDLPLILDDVVSSFDREHRANVADLLMQEFSEAQVLLFTHDLDWYVELKSRLPNAAWSFNVLAPWGGPETGIQWDRTPQGFGGARAHLDTDPGIAAGRARGIMDIHMAVIAERLKIPVPYIRGPQNDNRNARELINRFIGRGNKLKIRGDDGTYGRWNEPIERAEAARDLLVPFANPGAHGRQVSRNEAILLIDALEAFLESLKCAACETNVWHLTENSGRRLRCDCGGLRWIL